MSGQDKFAKHILVLLLGYWKALGRSSLILAITFILASILLLLLINVARSRLGNPEISSIYSYYDFPSDDKEKEAKKIKDAPTETADEKFNKDLEVSVEKFQKDAAAGIKELEKKISSNQKLFDLYKELQSSKKTQENVTAPPVSPQFASVGSLGDIIQEPTPPPGIPRKDVIESVKTRASELDVRNVKITDTSGIYLHFYGNTTECNKIKEIEHSMTYLKNIYDARTLSIKEILDKDIKSCDFYILLTLSAYHNTESGAEH